MNIRPLLLGTVLAITALPTLAIPAKPTPLHIEDSYQLSDGRRAHFVHDGSTLRMRLGTSPRERLLQDDGTGRFVSRDGQVSVVFTADASGRADQLTLSMPAATR